MKQQNVCIQSKYLSFNIDTRTGAFDIYDKKNKSIWKRDIWYGSAGLLFLLDNSKKKNIFIDLSKSKEIDVKKQDKTGVIIFSGFKTSEGFIEGNLKVQIVVENTLPEIKITINSLSLPPGFWLNQIHYPLRLGALKTHIDRGMLAIPVIQGVIIPTWPVRLPAGAFCEWYDASWDCGSIFLQTYTYSGLSMPWAGIAKENASLLMILETENDSGIFIHLNNGHPPEKPYTFKDLSRIASITPVWLGSLGKLRTERTLRLCCLPAGGYIILCKHFRKWIKRKKTFLTLKEKIAGRNDVKKLIGATSITLYGGYPHFKNAFWMNFNFQQLKNFIKELKLLGLDRAFISVWSIFANQPPDCWPIDTNRGKIKELMEVYRIAHNYNYLITSYHAVSCNLTHTSSYRPELLFKNFNGTFSGCCWTANCSYFFRQLLFDYLEKELKTLSPKSCFVDIIGTNLFECNHPRHRRTRSQWCEDIVSIFKELHNRGLVTATERGFSSLIPFVDYMDGLMYRGLPLPIVSASIPAPLFNLVFHDCVVVSTHPLDDYMTPSKLGCYVDKILRDLLFGNIPRFMTTWQDFSHLKNFIYNAHKLVSFFHKKIGLDELIEHHFESDNFMVQSSYFSSGFKVSVNFGNSDFILTDGKKLPEKGFLIHYYKKTVMEGAFKTTMDMKI